MRKFGDLCACGKILFLTITAFLITACERGGDGNWYDNMPRESWARFELVDTGQDWLQVYKLNDDTYAIYEGYQWQEAICYLLIGEEKALLVDTLQGIGDLKAVIDQLTDLPVIVMNTHTHYDHTSGNYQFDTIYGMDTEYTRINTLGHPNSDYEGRMTPETVWKNLPESFSYDTYESKPFEIDKFVSDGEVIDIGNREVEIRFIPGHTPDSVILVDRKHRLMMTGDTLYPAPIYVHTDEARFTDFYKSAELMNSYRDQVDFVLAGHNETMLSADYLSELYSATRAIVEDDLPSDLGFFNRTYDFDNFKIIVKVPLDYDSDTGG